MKSSDFYVYEHCDPSTGICFYVGKGKDKRAYHFNRRREGSVKYCKAVDELRSIGLLPLVKFVAIGLDENSAFDLERSRISELRLAGIVLANMTDGGDGASGHKKSEYEKEKLRNRVFSELHRKRISEANRGKPKSSEHRAKISASLKGRSPTNISRKPSPLLGVPRSDSVKLKISAALKGKPKLSNRGKIPWCKGKHLEQTTKNKMSLARIGKRRGPMTLEQKEKISHSLLGRSNLALKGKCLSAEHRQKLSDAWVRRKARNVETRRGATSEV